MVWAFPAKLAELHSQLVSSQARGKGRFLRCSCCKPTLLVGSLYSLCPSLGFSATCSEPFPKLV